MGTIFEGIVYTSLGKQPPNTHVISISSHFELSNIGITFRKVLYRPYPYQYLNTKLKPSPSSALLCLGGVAGSWYDLCVPLYAHEVFCQVSLETDMTISKKDPSLCLFVIEI